MKRLQIRAIVGFPLGICSAHFLAILISYGNQSASFLAVLPFIEGLCKTNLQAVALQTLCAGLIGCFSVSIVTLFETPLWSNRRTILIHTITIVLAQVIWILILTYLPLDSSLFYGLFTIVILLTGACYFLLLKNTKHHVAYLNVQLENMKRGESHDC